MSQNPKLKPCPFCGAKAVVWRTNYQVFVECEKYRNDTHERHIISVSGKNDEEAAEAWNRRYEDD